MNIIKISLLMAALTFGSPVQSEMPAPEGKAVEITVYRSPTCGCCGKWVDHLRENRFNINDVVRDDMQEVKEKYGVPRQLQSCHTAIVDGYVIEGHVPAGDIRRLLNIKPKVVGLSVPGMPVGTPGMEMGERQDPYQVISFDENDAYRVFSRHGGK